MDKKSVHIKANDIGACYNGNNKQIVGVERWNKKTVFKHCREFGI